jgi:hypothetical protein
MTPEQKARFLAQLQRDPVLFARKILRIEPWDMQCQIAYSVRDNRHTVVRSCHGSGKTWLAAWVALWFLFVFKGSRVVSTAPSNRQVENLLWAEINAMHARARDLLGGKCTRKRLEIDPDWFAIGFAPKEYTDDSKTMTGFQGFHAAHILAIEDEAAGISPKVSDAIDGILTSQGARKLSIGNPTDPSCPFAKSFRDPHTKKFRITAFDTPNFKDHGIGINEIRDGSWETKLAGKALRFPAQVTPHWVADKIRPEKWGEANPHWTAKVMGEFPELGTDTLIPMIWVERARLREPDYEGHNHLGVDVARFGSNETIIMHRRGKTARVWKRVSGQNTMQVAGLIKAAIRDTGATLVKVDEIGVGAGVVDALREDGEPVVGINVGRNPSDTEQFSNLRAELYWHLRGLFERGEIAIEGGAGVEDMEGQLSSLKFKYQTRTGKIQIESKDEMAKRGMPSPDLADALMLAFATGFDNIVDAPVEFGEAPLAQREWLS